MHSFKEVALFEKQKDTIYILNIFESALKCKKDQKHLHLKNEAACENAVSTIHPSPHSHFSSLQTETGLKELNFLFSILTLQHTLTF